MFRLYPGISFSIKEPKQTEKTKGNTIRYGFLLKREVVKIAERIKGITVEIGGDTVGLQNALRDVNATSRNLSNELRQVNRMLEFDPGNADLLAQRQTILNQQIETTEEKLRTMRSVYSQVEEQFQRGDIGAEQWRRFQREVIQTERRLEQFQNEIRETEQTAEKSGSNIKDSLGNALAGAAAGAGAGAVIQKALDTAGLETQIKLSFQVPEEQIPKVKEIITNITNMGVEGEAAIEGVRRQLAMNLDKTTEQNEKILQYAGLISKAYADIDFTELVQESNELANALGISQEEALGMTNALLKGGFPPDQLDIITEYGSQLARAGYSASEIQGIFAAGVETKSWNIDVLLDGVKEGRIRLAEFSEGIDKATAGLIEGTSISAEELKNWGAAVAAGGDEGKVAFGTVAAELAKIEDAGKRNAIGTKLFGTLWEEQGKKITESMMGANSHAGDLAENVDVMNQGLEATNADPQVRLNTALSELMKTLTPLLIKIAEFVAGVADWVAKNPELAATITAVVTAIGILMGIFMALAPVVTALITAAGFLGTTIAALSAPILIAIAAIAALIAIGVAIWKNWDWLSAKAVEWTAKVDKAFEDWKNGVRQRFNEQIEDVKKWVANINRLFEDWKAGVRKRFTDSMDDIKRLWNGIMEFFRGIDLKKIGSDIISGLREGISGAARKVYEKAEEIANNIGKKIRNALKVGSPSKVTWEIGKWTGQGLIEGLHDTISSVQQMSVNLANTLIDGLSNFADRGVLTEYFNAIREDGDWLNDMLVHMPKNIRGIARELGKALAPTLEGTKARTFPLASEMSKNAAGQWVVNINSPKALDTREAAREFNRTMNRMTMFW